MKIVAYGAMALGIIGGAIVIAKGRVADGIIGGAFFIALGFYTLSKCKK